MASFASSPALLVVLRLGGGQLLFLGSFAPLAERWIPRSCCLPKQSWLVEVCRVLCLRALGEVCSEFGDGGKKQKFIPMILEPPSKLIFAQFKIINARYKVKSQTKYLAPIAVMILENLKSFNHSYNML